MKYIMSLGEGFLGPNGTRFAYVISGPKKVSIFRAHSFQYPRNDVAGLKTITYRAIKTTGTLIVYNIMNMSILHDTKICSNTKSA